MRLVEVVRGLQTSDATVAAAQQFAAPAVSGQLV
jgi:3-hydroxyacyl-CoA dehydrogenase